MLLRILILIALIFFLTAATWSGLWRLYRWLYQGGPHLPTNERTILERQIVAMGVYFPVHLAAILMPVPDALRGYGSIFAAFALGYIGASAVQNRLFTAFNRNGLREDAAVRERLAVAAGVVLLLLALVILTLGIYLLNRPG